MTRIKLPRPWGDTGPTRPCEGDWVRGTCAADGRERSGKFVRLADHLPVIRTKDGNEWPVLSLDDMEPFAMICRHGLKVVEPVPAEHDEGLRPHRPPCTLGRDDPFHTCPETPYCPGCFPEIRQVEPWPCTPQCFADFEEAQRAEEEEYWAGVNDLIRAQYE